MNKCSHFTISRAEEDAFEEIRRNNSHILDQDLSQLRTFHNMVKKIVNHLNQHCFKNNNMILQPNILGSGGHGIVFGGTLVNKQTGALFRNIALKIAFEEFKEPSLDLENDDNFIEYKKSIELQKKLELSGVAFPVIYSTYFLTFSRRERNDWSNNYLDPSKRIEYEQQLVNNGVPIEHAVFFSKFLTILITPIASMDGYDALTKGVKGPCHYIQLMTKLLPKILKNCDCFDLKPANLLYDDTEDRMYLSDIDSLNCHRFENPPQLKIPFLQFSKLSDIIRSMMIVINTYLDLVNNKFPEHEIRDCMKPFFELEPMKDLLANDFDTLSTALHEILIYKSNEYVYRLLIHYFEKRELVDEIILFIRTKIHVNVDDVV